jgi:hypothetical protein
MSMSILYGSTLWLATTLASAQVAFQGAFPGVADRVAEHAAAAAVSNGHAAPARNCPYCDGGECIVCNQSVMRFDLEDRAAIGYGYDEPCFTPAMPYAAEQTADAGPAPQATEPDDVSADAVAVVEKASDVDADAERGGMLTTMARVAERVPGAGFVRSSLSSGAMEASRAVAWTRRWLAGSPQVATVAEKPATAAKRPTKLEEWFGESATGDLAVETTAEAELPSEAVAMAEETAAEPAVTAHVEMLDWEGEIAREYLAAAGESARGEENLADPRHDVVTPTIRTAAVALEHLGNAAIDLAGRLRGLAEATKYQ